MYQGVVWLCAVWPKRPCTRVWSGCVLSDLKVHVPGVWSGCVLGDLTVHVPGYGLVVCWVA